MGMDDVREWSLPGPAGLRFTRREVAAWLDVSEDTIDRMIDAGSFPRGSKASPQSSPTWTGLDLAAWLHLRDRWCPATDRSRERPGAAEGK